MMKSEALARIHETYTEDELLDARDEPDADLIERLFGIGRIPVHTYNDVQREFGWDDTH